MQQFVDHSAVRAIGSATAQSAENHRLAPFASRLAAFLYGVASYALFLATFLYACGFVGGFLVPRTIDGAPVGPLWQSLLIDFALLALFGVQHSVMARPAFKRWWTQFIPEAAERSTYVLASSLALVALFVFWQPLGGRVWHFEPGLIANLLWVVFGFGWGLVLVTTFLINHFDLFGLRQVWLHLLGRPYRPLKFVTPGPYRLVRHPLYVGWLLAFWATPTMSMAHFVFASLMAIYILIAIQYEERDLVAYHGEEYQEYRRRVAMLVPRIAGGNRRGR
ncbi:MAG: isoprenylcysteine carboxylmethyltransferase family protein [Phycisphaerae bacterium]|nr:isoprenylcysteine carboxylmethyltransferase family protein [Phycisphaerae bacterium]